MNSLIEEKQVANSTKINADLIIILTCNIVLMLMKIAYQMIYNLQGTSLDFKEMKLTRLLRNLLMALGILVIQLMIIIDHLYPTYSWVILNHVVKLCNFT